jgi:hypothetical protein
MQTLAVAVTRALDALTACLRKHVMPCVCLRVANISVSYSEVDQNAWPPHGLCY